MDHLPLVSVITIVYNGEKHLRQTIESVLGQTYSSIEYIIIDGGSTDGSIAIIREYSDKLAYWISEKDKGISDAFNKGIQKANGEIVGLINSDDWYERDAIEKMVKEIVGFDVAYGQLRLWKGNKQEVIFNCDHQYIDYEMTLNHPTVFVKRDCYLKFGLFDLGYKYAMDYDLLLRFKMQGCRFVHVGAVLANMRWEGLSDQTWVEACKEVRKIKDKYLPEKKLFHRLYFFKQVVAIRLGKFLQKIGFQRLVRFYRSRFSRVPKIYE